jgi:uncharacterized protein (DUF1499 family)
VKIKIMSATSLCVVFIVGCTGGRPSSIGINDGSLASCPRRPNCVSSKAEDKRHFVEPFAYTPGNQLPQEDSGVIPEINDAT